MKTDFIELFAGTAAVSLAALGAPCFPCSRIGSKRGWAQVILAEMRVKLPVQRATVVEADRRMVRVLRALFGKECADLADQLDYAATLTDPEALWRDARAGRTAFHDLLWLCGARGGIGGFKGAHKLRPSVDGFIPSRTSLAKRVRAFLPFRGRMKVIQAYVEDLDPAEFPLVPIYADAPYFGRQGYAKELKQPLGKTIAAWQAAGHKVAVSEASALIGCGHSIDLTKRRRGQARRSLTRDQSEWLSFFQPTKIRR